MAPRRIAVVPFKDRHTQLNRLLPTLRCHFDRILVVEPARYPFDRGWVKNVGFWLSLAGPADSVYFHDVDTLPVAPDWAYPPVPRGSMQHLYGHTHCLGGIVGVDPAVFMGVGGFSHSPSWGGEDRHLQTACVQHNIPILRHVFEERFKTTAVEELTENGSTQSTEQLYAEMQAKLAQSTYRAFDTGKLHACAFTVVSLVKLHETVFHYIVK